MGTFKDVASDAWYAGVVNYAAYKGWIKGYGDGNFGPMDNVIGYDALTMILRMMGYGAFDELTGTNYRANAIELATTKLNALDNTDKNSVDYSKIATREEVFEYLYGAMGNVPVIKANADDLTYTPDGTETLLEKKGFENEATYTYELVTAVPATDKDCYEKATATTKEVFKVTFEGDPTPTTVAATENFGAEYVGKVVKALRDGATGKVYSLEVISRDVKVEEDLSFGSGKTDDYKTLGDFIADATNNDTLKTLVDGEIGAAKDNDENKLAAGIYTVVDKKAIDSKYTNNSGVENTNTASVLVTYASLDQNVKLEKLEVSTDKDTNVVTYDFAETATVTYNPKAASNDSYDAVTGISGLKDGKYAVAITKLGDFTTAKVLDVVSIEGVTSVKKDNTTVTSFVSNGKTYEIITAADSVKGYNITKSGLAEAAITGVDAELTRELVVFEGKVVPVAAGTYTDAVASVPDFDGWAKVRAIDIKVTDPESSLGSSLTAPTVNYAKVEVLTNEGKVLVYDLDVIAELNSDGDAYEVNFYKNGLEGNKKVLTYTSGTAFSEVTENIIKDGKFYAYSVDNGVISFYDEADVAEEDVVSYKLVDIAGTINKNDTTTSLAADAVDSGMPAEATDVDIKNASFIALKSGETDNKKFELLKGTASFTSVSGNLKAVVKATKSGDVWSYAIEYIFADTYQPLTSTSTKTFVYVDKDSTTVVIEDGRNVTYYATYGADGNIDRKAANAVTIDASSLYELNTDGTIGTKKDIASITESDIVTLNNTYVKLDGVNRDYTGASIILVGDNTFEDGATVVYILNEDNENVVDYIWVIG